MKNLLMIALVFLSSAIPGLAQLTHEQKMTDFKALVGVYDKDYGPYEWKKKAFGFDLLKIQPWLDQVDAAPDDLSFYDVCVRYVASLHDTHSEFVLPGNYEAWLPITADIYDGKVLIDFVDRTVLDPQSYPFDVGDELLAVDGKSVGQWTTELSPYAVNGQGSSVSRSRLAVATMLDRFQGWYPFANKVNGGDTATILVRSQNGKVASFQLTWDSVGLPMDHEGPVPNPGSMNFHGRSAFSNSQFKRPMRDMVKAAANPWGVWTGPRPEHRDPPMSKAEKRRRELQKFSAVEPDQVTAGGLFPFGSIFPAFNPPAGFKLRLGFGPSDEFLSGTFPVGNRNIGFIRIPAFEPNDEANALQQFQNEMIFFQQNTSGLVVDVMDNSGGDACYTNELVRQLSPHPFSGLPLQIRATEWWITILAETITYSQGVPESDIDLEIGFLGQLQEAMEKNRGLTSPIPFFSPVTCEGQGGLVYQPGTDAQGNNIAYGKPILVLTNNFTLSAAEFFTATLQDENRVVVYGTRTDGGGGNVAAYEHVTGPYSEGSVRVTQSLALRNHLQTAPGLPPAPYLENFGVTPDYVADFQTKTNLLTGGQPFVNGFTAVIWQMTNHP